MFDHILVLFAGKSKSLEQLQQCRINPDYSSPTRNDLEYYIPQLCGYLTDESKPQTLRDGLFTILMKASHANFYFSHRLYFFLQSYAVDPGLSEYVRSV